jgi:hypothetical protein
MESEGTETKKRPWNPSDDLRMARNCFLISFTIGALISFVNTCTEAIVLAAIMFPICIILEILVKVDDKKHADSSSTSL